MDCVKLTLLGTQRTADTANLAGCLDSRSTIVGAALYQMFCLVRYQVDQVFRAGCHAGTTRYTLLFVYNRYAVYHVDCIVFSFSSKSRPLSCPIPGIMLMMLAIPPIFLIWFI